jgi:hypothetical protein
LAGVSTTWHTCIEQSPDLKISDDELATIAKALRLLPHEKPYLYTLVGRQLPADASAAESISPTLQHILDHQAEYPAYIMGRYWHILAWNRAASRLFGDFTQMPHCNMLWYTCAWPAARALVSDWSERAQRLVAEFRADCSAYSTDPWLAAFLDELRSASPEFALWWAQHDVHGRDGGLRRFQHAEVGLLVLEQTTFRLSQMPDHKLVLHVPLAEADSAAKLLALSQNG